VSNKYYYDKSQIKWSKIVVKAIDNPATMLRSIQSGQLDVAMGDPSTFSAAKGAGLNVSTAAGGWSGLTFWDLDGKPVKALGDVRVRQALNYAINRQAIAESLFAGAAQPTSEPVTLDGWVPALQNYYPYDPAKAKQLLAQAGYPNGFTFALVAPTFGVGGTPMMQAIAQDWAAIGVKVNIIAPATNTDFFAKFMTEQAFENDQPPVPLSLVIAGHWVKGGALNPYDVVEPVLTNLETRESTAPPQEFSQLEKEISQLLTTQAYLAPVVTDTYILYSTKQVAGVQATPWLVSSPVALTWAPSS
jgi:peptide/nickel transport system substrate-binding protein